MAKKKPKPDPNVCPTCGRAYKTNAAVKLCAKCGKVIGRGHKYTYVTVNGMTTLQHRFCDEPEAYVRKPK